MIRGSDCASLLLTEHKVLDFASDLAYTEFWERRPKGCALFVVGQSLGSGERRLAPWEFRPVRKTVAPLLREATYE